MKTVTQGILQLWLLRDISCPDGLVGHTTPLMVGFHTSLLQQVMAPSKEAEKILSFVIHLKSGILYAHYNLV